MSRLGCMMLLAGIAAASAQEREVAPLPSLAPLVEEVAPAVVNISIQGTVVRQRNLFPNAPTNPFGPELFGLPPEREFRAAGSGVIVDAEAGYILTNHHVIENASEITITLVDNRTFDAAVVGSDQDSDLALLRIDGDDLTEIEFSTSGDLRVGDYVVAIGNPLGLTNTVTAGIVSAVGRGLNPGNPNLYEDFIQTDASINVGNSGGALVNLRGELVGVNSAIISQTGGNIGIGLSIPVAMATRVMDQLIEFGNVRHGLLGVTMESLTPDTAEELRLPASEGALVMTIEEGSGAEAAGVQVEDVIIGVNGERTTNGNELRNLIGFMRPGAEVEIDLMRDGKRMNVVAVLGTRPGEEFVVSTAEPPSISPEEPDAMPVLGGANLSEDRRYGVDGLVVLALEPASPLALRGVMEGDVITHINRQRVRTREEAETIVDSARSVYLRVRRADRERLIRLR